MKTIDQLVKEHNGNVAAAARAAGVDYIPFRRWLKRQVFSPPDSANRRLLRERGIELPDRPARRKR